MWEFARRFVPRFPLASRVMRHVLTEQDGQSYDLLKFIGFGFGLVMFLGGFLGLAIVLAYGLQHYLKNDLDLPTFCAQLCLLLGAFATGASTLMPSLAMSIKIRVRAEGPGVPDNPPDPPAQ